MYNKECLNQPRKPKGLTLLTPLEPWILGNCFIILSLSSDLGNKMTSWVFPDYYVTSTLVTDKQINIKGERLPMIFVFITLDS